jgi:hypothetical protein
MSKPTKEEAGRAIVDIIRNQSSGIATGPHVGAVLKYKLDSFQPLDFGVPTLKSFIQKFVPEVLVTVLSPTQVSYSLHPSSNPSLTGSESGGNDTVPDITKPSEEANPSPDQGAQNVWLPPDIWFAVVAAGSRHRLLVQEKTGQMRLDGVDSPASEGWVKIEPLTGEQHSAIAREFSGNVPPAHRARVDSLIGAGPTWWKEHFNALSALGLSGNYRRFHSAQVLQKLDSMVREKVGMGLKSLRLPAGLVSSYSPSTRSLSASTSKTVSQRLVAEPVKEELLRSLAEKLVRNMSRAELRRIKVALGDVVDLL